MSKDSVTAHLEKNTISNIIQTARASLKEPSRPFTPAEVQRTLFNNKDQSRPPSSYSIKSFAKDLEPIKQRPAIIEAPVQTNRKVVTEESKISYKGPVKVIQESEVISPEIKSESLIELKDLLYVLEKMKIHSEIQELYGLEDLELLLNSISECLEEVRLLEEKPQWASCEEVMRMLVVTFECFENDCRKLMKIAKCVFKGLERYGVLYKRSANSVVISNVALGAIKILYQLSKKSENDVIFIEEGMSYYFSSLLRELLLEDSYIDTGLPYDFLIFLLGILKNISTSEEISHDFFSLISIVSPLLPGTTSKKAHPSTKHSNLLIQATGLLKNLATAATFPEFQSINLIERLTISLNLYEDIEISLNVLKILSKFSLEEQACEIMSSSIPIYFKQILNFESALIISRSCYIIANILTVKQSAQNSCDPSWVPALINVSNKYLGLTDKLHSDVLIKSTRLTANLIISPHIGKSLEDPESLLCLLCEILSKYSTVSYEELILNTIACMTNLLYYDIASSAYISSQYRILAFSKLSPILVESFNEEITIEILRALGNLTRHDSVCKELPNLHMIEIFFMLLDHSDWNVIYYTLGCLVNVSSLAKELLYHRKCFESFINMLEETQMDEPELSGNVLMIVANLCSLSKGLVPWESVAGEENVKRLSRLVEGILKEAEVWGEVEEVRRIARVCEGLIKMMPKTLVACVVNGCGRKFANEELLRDHCNRRHAGMG